MLKECGAHWTQQLLQTLPGLGPIAAQGHFPGCTTTSLGGRFANATIPLLLLKEQGEVRLP